MKKKREERPGEKRQQQFIEKIVAGILSMQEAWAGFMRKRTVSLDDRSLKLGLFAFCLASVGCCLYIGSQPFLSRDNKKNYLQISPVQAPEHFNKTAEIHPIPNPVIGEADFLKIQSFLQYIDSLGRTQRGVVTRDSILLVRPGLMDSVLTIEKLYYSQKKMK
jgi:hypothetical protein